ncbi:hypothetical protein VPHD292_0097 [Vibrio phage D292]
MSRLTTVLSVNVPRHNDITGMCLIGCNGKTSLCVYCYWGGSGLHTPVCDAVTDNGISVPQELYEQVLRLCT